MPIPTFQKIRTKLGVSKETRPAIPATEPVGKAQNVTPEGFYIYPKSYYAAPAHVHHPPVAGFRQPDPRFASGSQSQEQPVSPIYAWAPEDFDGRQSFEVAREGPAIELEGTRGPLAQAQVRRPAADEGHLRQNQMHPNRRALEDAKTKAKINAERFEKAKVEEDILRRIRSASKESVRELRELVRERYRWDLSLLGEKGVLPADREIVLKDCKRADEVLRKIYAIVALWNDDLFDNKDDWKVAKKIKEGLMKIREDGLHNLWFQKPPWEIDSEPEQERTSDDEWDESDDE